MFEGNVVPTLRSTTSLFQANYPLTKAGRSLRVGNTCVGEVMTGNLAGSERSPTSLLDARRVQPVMSVSHALG